MQKLRSTLTSRRSPEETEMLGRIYSLRVDRGPTGRVQQNLRRSSRRRDFFVESDGTSNFSTRDPPGQNCTYVPPGDHRDEFYRLGTFGKYPRDVPVFPTDLAYVGFYYTGFNDRVKCFSCGITVENWVVGDDGADPQWHKTTCLMATGTDNENVPILTTNYKILLRNFKGLPNVIRNSGLGSSVSRSGTNIGEVTSNLHRIRLTEAEAYPELTLANVVDSEHEQRLRATNLRSEFERRNTFDKFPTYPAPFLVSDMAKEGFFYLGNLDRTQCFACSGVLRNWAPSDSVREQHERHFSHCKMVRGLNCGNIPMSDNQRTEMDREYRDKINRLTANNGEPPDPSPEEQRHLARYLPLDAPVNPHMRSLQRRIETFDRNWPRSRIHASIEHIARAGFFFLGESDKTKCFYCNGGLQNWDPNDEPWTEHAKWFPECEYVLRRKGVAFVQALRDAHPNLNRPYIRNPVAIRDIPPFRPGNLSMETEEPLTTNTQLNIDINQVLNMGFSQQMIDRAITRRGNNRGFADTEELIQDLLDHQHEEIPTPRRTPTPPSSSMEGATGVGSVGSKRSLRQETIDTEIKKTRIGSPSMTPEEETMARSLHEMEKLSLCRKCQHQKSEIMLTPCGHLSLCEPCSTSAKRCTVCNAKIQSKIKVYRA